MLLTLVRHACGCRQNNYEVHVLHRVLELADDVRKDTSSCVGRAIESGAGTRGWPMIAGMICWVSIPIGRKNTYAEPTESTP
jgi:hypothetical protein